MPKIKAIYVQRRMLSGDRMQQIKEARKKLITVPGYTKQQDAIVHKRTIEFPQETGFRSGGRIRFSQGGNLLQY